MEKKKLNKNTKHCLWITFRVRQSYFTEIVCIISHLRLNHKDLKINEGVYNKHPNPGIPSGKDLSQEPAGCTGNQNEWYQPATECFPPSPSALICSSLCQLSAHTDWKTARLWRRPLTLLMKKRPLRKRLLSSQLLTSVKGLAELQTSSTRPPWCSARHSGLLISISSSQGDQQLGGLPDRQ